MIAIVTVVVMVTQSDKLHMYHSRSTEGILFTSIIYLLYPLDESPRGLSHPSVSFVQKYGQFITIKSGFEINLTTVLRCIFIIFEAWYHGRFFIMQERIFIVINLISSTIHFWSKTKTLHNFMVFFLTE